MFQPFLKLRAISAVNFVVLIYPYQFRPLSATTYLSSASSIEGEDACLKSFREASVSTDSDHEVPILSIQ